MDIETLQPLWHDFIIKILWWLYHEEKILAQTFQKDWDDFEIGFHFPQYEKTITPLDHVSWNQIHEAIMEGMYLVIAAAVEEWQIKGISLTDFLSLRAVAIFREVQIKFKKEVTFLYKKPVLFFTLLQNKDIKWKFSTVTVWFSGFAEWNAKAAIQLSELVKDIISKIK